MEKMNYKSVKGKVANFWTLESKSKDWWRWRRDKPSQLLGNWTWSKGELCWTLNLMGRFCKSWSKSAQISDMCHWRKCLRHYVWQAQAQVCKWHHSYHLCWLLPKLLSEEVKKIEKAWRSSQSSPPEPGIVCKLTWLTCNLFNFLVPKLLSTILVLLPNRGYSPPPDTNKR